MYPHVEGTLRPPAGRPAVRPRGEASGVRRAAGTGGEGRPGGPPAGDVAAPVDDASPRIDEQFTRAVLPVVGRMVRVSRRILESDDLAWDAVQEALLGFWLQEATPADPEGWLIRATVHRSLHLARSIRRRRAHEARSCRRRPEASDHDDPTRLALAAEARSEVMGALGRLGDAHRDVLALHLIEGLDYESIARRLGISVGTVKSRLSRARAALRKILDAEFGDATRPDPSRPAGAGSDE